MSRPVFCDLCDTNLGVIYEREADHALASFEISAGCIVVETKTSPWLISRGLIGH